MLKAIAVNNDSTEPKNEVAQSIAIAIWIGDGSICESRNCLSWAMKSLLNAVGAFLAA